MAMNDREQVLDACRAIERLVERLGSLRGDYVAGAQLWANIASEAERAARVARAAQAESQPAPAKVRKRLLESADALRRAAALVEARRG